MYPETVKNHKTSSVVFGFFMWHSTCMYKSFPMTKNQELTHTGLRKKGTTFTAIRKVSWCSGSLLTAELEVVYVVEVGHLYTLNNSEIHPKRKA